VYTTFGNKLEVDGMYEAVGLGFWPGAYSD